MATVAAGGPVAIWMGDLMVDGDYPNAAAAYSMYVRDGWHWPLGRNPAFGDVNIFFSDAAPWFALLGKLVYSLFRVEIPFHALTLLNFVLFPVMAYRLMSVLTTDKLSRWLGVLLLSSSLIMPVRIIGAQHIALGSYWVVLWAMSAVPFPGDRAPRWRQWEFLLSLGIAVASHAYLGAMSAALIMGQLLWQRRWLSAIASLIGGILLLAVMGALFEPRVATGGAQHFAFDIFAYAQSLNWGIVPMLYPIVDLPQTDTMVYLGTGAWVALLLLILGWALRYWPAFMPKGDWASSRLVVLAIVGLLLVLFSMAFAIRVGGPMWFALPLLPPLSFFYENFRAVGRFAAVFAYVLTVLIAIWLGGAIRRKRTAIGIAVAAVALQAADLQYASTLSPRSEAISDRAAQTEIIDGLLAPGWSGRVYRDVDWIALEDQRLLDYLLVRRHGANWLSTAHGARLTPEKIAARSGYADAAAGDLVITTLEAGGPPCGRMAEFKTYRLCVI